VPVDTNAVTLTLDPDAERTIYSIVVLGGGTQVRTAPPIGAAPAFFAEAIFKGEITEWTHIAQALLLKTWLIDVFMGTVLEMAGTPSALSISLDAAADSLLEINNPAWQAALDKFFEGNIPGATLGLFNALTASPELQEEVFTIIVSVINGAAGGVFLASIGDTMTAGSAVAAPKYLLTEVGKTILGVLEGLNIAFVAADVLAVSHDLANSNIAELWTATLTAPTISLNPAKASVTAGQSVRDPLVPAPAKGGVVAMRAARLAGLVARQRPRALRRSLLAAQIAQASHAAPKLGRNIRPVTRNRWWAALNRTGV
jgi:hypothetical protein